jgi:hypothetical protein
MAANNTPPQVVFELVAIEAIRKFLTVDIEPEKVAEYYVSLIADQYDTDDLVQDTLALLEKLLKFISSVEISDVDLLLRSYQYFTCNFEKIGVKRNKKPLFRSLLKGNPLDSTRVYKASKSFVAYAYGMRSATSPLKPEEWTYEEEVEFAPIFDAIIPKETE